MSGDEKGKKSVILIRNGQIVPKGGVNWAPGTRVNEKPQAAAKLDVHFVIDTTLSMSKKITALLETAQQFVDGSQSLGLDIKFTVVSFGDISVEGGSDTIKVERTLTGDVSLVKKSLLEIKRNNGYGNEGESAWEAVQVALNLEHRHDSVQVLVLITDEPAHDHQITPQAIYKEVKNRGVLVFTVATDDWYYIKLATLNGGDWQQISANSDLSHLLEIFAGLAKKVAKIANDVHLLAGGDVKKFLLGPGSK